MRGNVAVHDNVRTILDAEILVCGTADAHSVGAATTNGRVTKFEPIQFEDPKHVEQFESIQCFPATGNHYVILATFVFLNILTTQFVQWNDRVVRSWLLWEWTHGKTSHRPQKIHTITDPTRPKNYPSREWF